MKILVLLLSIALLASCATSKNHNKNIESQIVVTDSGEDFNSFYHQFVSDSIFQVERVIFPIYVVRTRFLDSGEEHDSVVTYLYYTGWDYIRMSDYQESDQETQQLTFNSDSTEADLEIIDQTTVSTSYKSENGNWYLTGYHSYDYRNLW